MDADDVQRLLAEAAADRGVDTRLEFARARPDGSAWRVESTDPAWLESALARLHRVGVAGRGAVLAAPADRVAWVRASVAEVRREPRHAAEQVTQALQGETLAPLLHEDGWMLVRLADGYVGWVRDWHLQSVDAGAPAAHRARADSRIDAACVALRVEPHRDADAVGESVLGTHVVTHRSERAWVEIELPGGRTGWVPQAAVRRGTGDWPPTAESILAMLRRFLGVPYLWGGRSPKGFDCSGLVQFVYGLHGIALPRDSDQQARAGAPVEAPAAADLIVFGRERVTHVAVAASATHFLHARGEVRCNAAVADAPLHDAQLWALRCGFRRVLGPTAVAARG